MNSDARARVKSRVAELPAEVMDCEACGNNHMNIRRSSLRPEPCADDITLKCPECFRIRTHGVPVTRDELEEEMELRGNARTLDFAVDGAGTVEENLKHLGYMEM